MFQRNDLPRLPLAWMRFGYMNVTVSSLHDDGLASAGAKPRLLAQRMRSPVVARAVRVAAPMRLPAGAR